MIHGATLLAAGAALTSALTFGLSTSLQHRAATSLAGVAPRRLLAQLVKHPHWRVGITLSIAAFGLHAVALGSGPLTLVQPLIISGVVFAVLFRAALDHRRPSGRELGWVALTWAGLVAFIAGTAGTASTHPPQHAVLVTGVLAVGAAAAARQGGRARTPERRGLWLGVSAGILFGLVAAMIKLTAIAIAAGPGTGLLAIGWPLAVMLLAGLAAVALNQRAYRPRGSRCRCRSSTWWTSWLPWVSPASSWGSCRAFARRPGRPAARARDPRLGRARARPGRGARQLRHVGPRGHRRRPARPLLPHPHQEPPVITLVIAASAGAFAALHAASWGGFKDAPFEGFRLGSYTRSLVLGAGCWVRWSPGWSPSPHP